METLLEAILAYDKTRSTAGLQMTRKSTLELRVNKISIHFLYSKDSEKAK